MALARTRYHFANTFRALQHRNYRLWFFGQGLSLVGTWMQTMAQQVLVYRLTGSASALGIASFMQVIPLLPFALWGGSLSDRFPRRSLILITQSAMLIQALVLALLTGTGAIQVWHIYIMAFLLGVFKALDMPARQSFIVDMVEGKEDLTNAIGLNSAVHNGARTLGPALAGVAVAALGEAVAFLLNGLSFLAVIISLLAMRDLPKIVPVKDSKPVRAHMAEGLRYLFSQQILLVLMSLVAVNSFLSRPYTTLMPVFADTILKESSMPVVSWLCSSGTGVMNCRAPEALPLGMLLAAVGVGAVTGALVVASLPQKFRRGKLMTLGNLCLPAFLVFFVNSRSLILSCFILMLVGFGQVLQNATANTLLQITAPDELRGRVMSQYSLVTQGMSHLGGLQAGFMADWLSAPLSIGLGAGAALVYGAYIAVRYPRVRNMS